MLSERDQDRLNAIARELREDDRRFCIAVEVGRPRSPKEYRQRWIRMLVVVVVLAAVFITAVAARNSVALVIAIGFSTLGTVLVQLPSPDRPWRRHTLRPRTLRLHRTRRR